MSSIITDEIRSVIAGQPPFVATVNADGTPNLGPKLSLRVYDDTSFVFKESTKGQTLTNLQRGSKVAVAFLNSELRDGYRFIGTPEVLESGAVWESVAKADEAAGRPVAQYVVQVHIEEIFSLKPGSAGKPA